MSSGERKRKRPNQRQQCHWGWGLQSADGVLTEVHGKAHRRMWESCKWKDEVASRIQSTAGHVKSGGKPGGPPSKPKYYPMTDSEEYCEGKVKRTPGGEWKRTWNPVLTSTESSSKSDQVPIVEWSGELWYAARLSTSGVEPKREQVLIGRQVVCHRPETGWPSHVQAEVEVKLHGGPHPRSLKRPGMTCG